MTRWCVQVLSAYFSLGASREGAVFFLLVPCVLAWGPHLVTGMACVSPPAGPAGPKVLPPPCGVLPVAVSLRARGGCHARAPSGPRIPGACGEGTESSWYPPGPGTHLTLKRHELNWVCFH